MKILEVKPLIIPSVIVIRYLRFSDSRGYFTETYRESDVEAIGKIFPVQMVQSNESYSKKGVVRGLHFQWNPYMGKLVRTISGHMVDLALDIRKDSPWQGKIIAYDMPVDGDQNYGEWIWIPPGFAHGNFFLEDTTIEYFCSGEYNPNCEACIGPLSHHLDWSLCDPLLRHQLLQLTETELIMSDKDSSALSFVEWMSDERARNFNYDELK